MVPRPPEGNFPPTRGAWFAGFEVGPAGALGFEGGEAIEYLRSEPFDEVGVIGVGQVELGLRRVIGQAIGWKSGVACPSDNL